MKVTEHNITNWELDVPEIKTLIRIIKDEIKNHEKDKVVQTYYGVILRKLLIMKFDKDTSESGPEEVATDNL